MNKKLFVLQLFLLFCFNQAFAQDDSSKKFQISPYLGISQPQEDFKDFAKSGTVFGIAADRYLNRNFALGLDINFQSNSFTNPFDFSSIGANSVTNTSSSNWKATTFTLGPTYRIGSSKFNAEVYLKLGLLYTKTAQATSIYQYTGGPKTIFELQEQKHTGFGLTSGIRLNYQISKNLSLFLNPQYVTGSAKVEYCDCGTEGLSDPDVILDQQPIKETINPTYFNVNAGLTFSFGGEGNDNDASVSRNLPGCMESLQTPQIECTDAGPKVYIKSEWWGQAPTDVLSVSVYDGSTLVYSGNTISNNNQPLGSTVGVLTHYFNALGYEGRALRVEITIDNQTGVTSCYKNNLIINIPDCEYDISCGWDYNITCDEHTNSIKINVASSWGNVPVGSTLTYSLINLTPPGNSIPYNSSPNNLPLAISGTGSTINNLNINGFGGVPFVFKMQIIGPDGTVLCEQATDTVFPECEFTSCEPKLISASCENGNVTIDFEVPWTNFNQFANLFVFADIYDSNGNLIQSLSRPLTGINGTAQFFNISLPQQFAGTTIHIQTRICKIGEPAQKCDCLKKLTIEIPICCEICSDVNDIKDTTEKNQTNLVDFVLTGVITQSSNPVVPIQKVVAQLEAIKFQPINNTPLTISNFEFTRSWFANGGSQNTISTRIVGSVLGNRSNLIITDINPPSASNMIFRLNVDNYNFGRDLRVESYKVKFTIYKTDGTYCDKFMIYNR